MRFIELFAGIGGFRLGLESAGHECVWANERDSYACKVYRKNWPDGTLFEGDIRSVDPTALPSYDLLVGGFPCQPVSLAGRRKAQKDERWLWPEIVRFFRATRPPFLLLENVPGLLSAGMGDILRDMADGGYDAEWDCIPAAALGAPHLRYRIFIVGYALGSRFRGQPWWRAGPEPSHRHQEMEGQPLAYSPPLLRKGIERSQSDGVLSKDVGDSNRLGRIKPPGAEFQTEMPRARGPDVADAARNKNRRRGSRNLGQEAKGRQSFNSTAGASSQDVADTDQPGLQGRLGGSLQERTTQWPPWSGGSSLSNADAGRRDGRPWFFRPGWRPEPPHEHWWATEPDVGRVAHGISSRVDRLRCLGNAVVPQVIAWIGQRFAEIEKEIKNKC